MVSGNETAVLTRWPSRPDTGVAMPPPRMPDLDRETERRLAAGLYNEVWRLMELPKRRPEQDPDEMLLTDFGDGENWDEAAVYEALARAYSVAGNRDESRRWIAKARQTLKSIE